MSYARNLIPISVHFYNQMIIYVGRLEKTKPVPVELIGEALNDRFLRLLFSIYYTKKRIR